jgi:hypothetical protein
MPNSKQTTVILTKEVQHLKNELAGIYGLKNLLSASILLFSRQGDSEQKKIIKEINQQYRTEKELQKTIDKENAISYVKKLSLVEGGYDTEIKILSKEDADTLAELRQILGPEPSEKAKHKKTEVG